MIYSTEKFTLETPRPVQVDIINEILSAIDKGYKNIILEAGTGIGKSVCATTIANYFTNSYIITMTNQLLQQYLRDFDNILEEIKGKDNYPCRFTDEIGKCMIEKHNEKLIDEYNQQLIKYQHDPANNTRPKKPEINRTCGQKCPFVKALQKALKNDKVITNYDFLYYAGNFAGILPKRDLIVFDESHNLESKIMNLTIKSFNRRSIYRKYNIDIFDGIHHGMTLERLKKDYDYWITICDKIISLESKAMDEYIKNLKADYFRNSIHISDADERIFEMEVVSKDKGVKQYQRSIDKYNELKIILESEDWIIELPTKKEILADETYRTPSKAKSLVAEFKPLTISEYSDDLLSFGETRLFMTGTLGSKEMFCRWIGLDPDETYHIYQKSPFPVENRPIIRDYAGRMSGRDKRSGKYNWEINEDALLKIHDILEEHKDEKGVIHVSSNRQAWFIRNELKEYCRRPLQVAYGKTREESISKFEEWDGNMVLIGAGIKDGVDFADDKCRFQIIFKVPFPSLASVQMNIRKRYDVTWYIYQTVMPLMQAYGRGIRNESDYCRTYVLDSDFESLISDYGFLFNEYFLEAVEGFDWESALRKSGVRSKVRRVRRVKRVPRVQSEAK